MHSPNDIYTGEHLDEIAFPLGGIGAGMLCLTGRGSIRHPSLRHRPNLNCDPFVFAGLHVRNPGTGSTAIRVVECTPSPHVVLNPGRSGRHPEGFPKFARGAFKARFPFAELELEDPGLPGLAVRLTGWSPFVPGDSEVSSLPCAGLEYRFANTGSDTLELTFSYHAENFLRIGDSGSEVRAFPNGFMLHQAATREAPHLEGALVVAVPGETDPVVNHRWFRGGWFDAPTSVFESIRQGTMPAHGPVDAEMPSAGGSLYSRFALEPGVSHTVRVHLSWYVPHSNLNKIPSELRGPANCGCGEDSPPDWPTHEPFYASLFESPEAVARYWDTEYVNLRRRSAAFRDSFFASDLPPEILEAVSANLTILKSPTVLRQKDGKLWAWEGTGDSEGCCYGTCTHVWGYAQALPHLLPDLERGMRETEFLADQDDSGHQDFRAALPIEVGTAHTFHAALDGQLGGIMKVHREWRISGDTAWMKGLYPRARAGFDYCQATFDPDRTGTVVEPHHNTYDIEFWGPNGMTTSYYLGALKALIDMGEEIGEDVAPHRQLLESGLRAMETDLWDGDMFIQRVVWQGLRADDPVEFARKSIGGSSFHSEEALELLEEEGPRYQYGPGCLSDGVLGEWLAWTCGLPPVLDPAKVRSHLLQVHAHNYRASLADHLCPQRWQYALPDEGGLLLCSWPRGGKPKLPFPYSDEVWTGIEYQVASHLISIGESEKGLEIVRTARRRYDGSRRNPFDEVECGHWYARALSSYALLHAWSGIRYDAIANRLYIRRAGTGDAQCFFSTDGGFGLAGIRNGKPFLDLIEGALPDPEFVLLD